MRKNESTTAERKKLFVTIHSENESFFEGDVSYLINKLTTLLEEWKSKGYSDISCSIDTHVEYSCYDDNIAIVEVHFDGSRLETDKEVQRRVAADKKFREQRRKQAATRRINKEKQERAMYEKLKKKFETARQ